MKPLFLSIIFLSLIATTTDSANARDFTKDSTVAIKLPPVLGNVKTIIGPTNSAEFTEFLNLLETHQDLFSLMEIQTSEAETLTLGYGAKGYVGNSYNQITKTLSAGPLQCDTGKSTSEIPVLLHEFSHSVFSSNMSLALKNELEKGKRYADTYVRAVLRATDAHGRLPIGIDEVLGPFNELFADLFAVLVLDDPKAMSDMFEVCKGDIALRDFSFDYPVESWNVGTLGGMFDRRHELLNPVRSYVWQKFNKDLRTKKNGRALLIQAVFNSSIEIAKDLFQQQLSFDQWRHIDQSKLNQKLIQEIEQKLQ